MNEKAVFFSGLFFFSGLENRMNEWHVNFSAEKKKQKNAQKWGKKKHNKFLLKKIGGSSKSEWMADELFRGKKKHILFFFWRHWKKKNTILGFEWMNDQRSYPGKKKYGTFVAT